MSAAEVSAVRPDHPPADPAWLAASGLTVRYGSLTVLDAVDFVIGPGEAVGIVGPNGAGKTTLLNALAGSAALSAGRVEFDGADISHLSPARRCLLGIGRAFQVPRPFTGMTVLENVVVGARFGGQLSKRAADIRCLEVLERCGLIDVANRPASSLGLLHRKRLELARALATGPSLLLLDEIGGGLTDAEAAQLVTTILQLRELGLGIVWIEHIVHVLIQVVDRMICMDAGHVIADGRPDAVLSDAAVVDAYLGRKEQR